VSGSPGGVSGTPGGGGVSGTTELRGGPVVRGLDPTAEALAEAGEAYRAVLDPLEVRPGVDAIERVWAFPPREIRGVPVALIVASAFAEEEGRRRLITSRVVVEPVPEGAPSRRQPDTSIEVAQQGVVPADRVRRVLEGVVRRLGVDLSDEAPADFPIDGDEEAWGRMREALHAMAAPGETGEPVGETGEPVGEAGEPVGEADGALLGMRDEALTGTPGEPRPATPGEPRPATPGEPRPATPGEPLPATPGETRPAALEVTS